MPHDARRRHCGAPRHGLDEPHRADLQREGQKDAPLEVEARHGNRALAEIRALLER